METNHGSFSSHEHPLELCQLTDKQIHYSLALGDPAICLACKQAISPGEWIYACICCSCVLHISCSSQTPRLIHHPLHPQHPLTFHSVPKRTVSSISSITCVACCISCKSDSTYQCSTCDVRIHIHCASKPLYVNHQSHEHPLHLTSYNHSSLGRRDCGICLESIKPRSWFYSCGSCNYYAHLSCATGNNENDLSFRCGMGFPPLHLDAKVNAGAKTVRELQNEITDLKAKYEELHQLVMKAILEK